MTTFLSEELRADLDAASIVPVRRRRAPRLSVRAGGRSWPVLRRLEGGFALAAETAATLRGHVDLYEDERHVMTALVIRASERGRELVFEYKRATPARDAAPVDFEIPGGAPAGLIEANP